ncbi:hypothetical protein BDW22DRAFT_1428679 [Trametopsis cervina]|nr:hypothetical protein BDW22DRAFT_1428679 [Trametopsis cervina]
MAPPKPAKKAKSPKREKLFHPQSRKADQLVRAQHRKSKLADLAKSRVKKFDVQADIYGFFFAAMPPEGVLTLEDLHTIIREVWLPRYDSELEEERAARRKGRPKSTKETKIEELKLRESEEYRTGMEVVDLTHPANVKLFREWDQKEAPFVQQLRFIRIFSSNPETFTISRPGKHFSLIKPTLKTHTPVEAPHQDMAVDGDDAEAPLLLEPPERFASTMMTMDGSI